jgi:hypothetical protein
MGERGGERLNDEVRMMNDEWVTGGGFWIGGGEHAHADEGMARGGMAPGKGAVPEFSGLNEETDPGAQRTDLGAEGRGLEPPTGFPAPDFESGRWPIRLPSELVDFQFIRPLKVGQ